MNQKDIHDIKWLKNRLNIKSNKTEVMSSADYRKYINKNTIENKRGQSQKYYMAQELKKSNLPLFPEYKFSSDRKFRFDWAIITTHCAIGIEYEGLMSRKSGHTTITGYTKDTEKYNLAQSIGWIVLRYTALNYKNMMKDVLSVIDKSIYVATVRDAIVTNKYLLIKNKKM